MLEANDWRSEVASVPSSAVGNGTLADPRLRFRSLVALNALGIVRRELEGLPPEDDAAQRELAARIRSGEVPAGTLARVKADVEARLRIDSPAYLERG